MSLSHRDVCTHIENEEDQEVLLTRAIKVNMRLLKTSPYYYSIISSICEYIKWSGETLKSGYTKPKGWSGPNAGFPLRIIYVPPYGIMINPKWIKNNGNGYETVQSNCGSLIFKKSIKVTREKNISVEYFTIDGRLHTIQNMGKENGGYTFQHEYHHIEGILIGS